MQIITLTSDWGLTDHYTASVKGKIITTVPGASIVDISHSVKPFNLRQASYIIKNCFRDFPDGTIHIIAVNTIENKDFRNTAIFYKKQFFIGNDNGLLSLIFDEKPDKIIEISKVPNEKNGTFTAVDHMVATARQITSGKNIESLGNPKENLAEQLHFKPVVTADSIKGIVIYVDNYENVITNITADLFDNTRAGRNFTIECRGERISRISNTYLEEPAGDIVALFNRAGYLEIAINQGNASGLLGLQVDDPVSVVFS